MPSASGYSVGKNTVSQYYISASCDKNSHIKTITYNKRSTHNPNLHRKFMREHLFIPLLALDNRKVNDNLFMECSLVIHHSAFPNVADRPACIVRLRSEELQARLASLVLGVDVTRTV